MTMRVLSLSLRNLVSCVRGKCSSKQKTSQQARISAMWAMTVIQRHDETL